MKKTKIQRTAIQTAQILILLILVYSSEFLDTLSPLFGVGSLYNVIANWSDVTYYLLELVIPILGFSLLVYKLIKIKNKRLKAASLLLFFFIIFFYYPPDIVENIGLYMIGGGI